MPAWPVGDLIASRAQPIAIAGEEVTVRPESVEIRYRFVNRSSADIETPVILPLPDIGPEILSTAAGPRRDPQNIIDLVVSVDGRPVTPEVTLRAMLGARDMTAVLQREQIPVSLFARNLVPALTGRPIRSRRALASAGLAEFGELGGYDIKWTMRGWFTWRQAFPRERPVEITLRYRPISAGFGADDTALDLPAAERRCLGDAAQAEFARGRLPASLFPMAIRVDLSLGGATNWAGPPEIFGLAIDAGDPGLVAATCVEGMTRSAPGRLDGRFAAFAPRGAITVLFLPVRAPARSDRTADAGDPRFPEASLMRLSALRVFGHSPQELRAMRAAIMARAGGPDRVTATERANLLVIAARLTDLGQVP